MSLSKLLPRVGCPRNRLPVTRRSAHVPSREFPRNCTCSREDPTGSRFSNGGLGARGARGEWGLPSHVGLEQGNDGRAGVKEALSKLGVGSVEPLRAIESWVTRRDTDGRVVPSWGVCKRRAGGPRPGSFGANTGRTWVRRRMTGLPGVYSIGISGLR